MKINHELTIRTIANGATRGFCTCGWRSKVSDEGHMFMDDYVSEQDIKREFVKHVTDSNPKMSPPVTDSQKLIAVLEKYLNTMALISLSLFCIFLELIALLVILIVKL